MPFISDHIHKTENKGLDQHDHTCNTTFRKPSIKDPTYNTRYTTPCINMPDNRQYIYNNTSNRPAMQYHI